MLKKLAIGLAFLAALYALKTCVRQEKPADPEEAYDAGWEGQRDQGQSEGDTNAIVYD